MQTIVELPEFKKRASSLLKEDEKTSIINYLAAHPQSGEKANLSKAERNDLAKFTSLLLQSYGGSNV